MHRLIIAGALAASFVAGPAAFAATAPAKAPVANAAKDRRADCEHQWKAEKKHSQTRKAFIAACMKS